MEVWNLHMAYRRNEPQPAVEFCYQPAIWVIAARAYGDYCRWTYPAMRRIEKLHKAVMFWWARNILRLSGKYFENYLDGFVPLTNRQDVRHDRLWRKGRYVVDSWQLTLENYRRLAGIPEDEEGGSI